MVLLSPAPTNTCVSNFFLSDNDYTHVLFFCISGGIRYSNVRMTNESLDNGDYRISLYTRVSLRYILVAIDYDIGCNFLRKFFVVRNTNHTNAFQPYRPGRILAFPAPTIAVEADQWYDVNIAMETYDDTYRLELEKSPQYVRNESGLVGLRWSDSVLRYDADVLDDSGWSGKKFSLRTRAKIPADVIDALIMVQLNREHIRGDQDMLEHFSVSYMVNIYRSAKTAPLIQSVKCNYLEPEPYEDGDTIVVPKIQDQPGCFTVRVNGNPVPEFAVAEMIDAHTSRLVRQRNFQYMKMATHDEEYYYLAPLANGEVKHYQAVAVNSQGFVSQKFRLEGYDPARVTVSQNVTVIETNGTKVRI